ncbi:MAG: type II toxin-antitoxin system Phd/YefM family antitoxin [Proteobacteria bacterium]|nr:type II toxin-antitoxin system Phd/YefM family antitoxin [Pseudomonadota bacterium]
MKTLNIHETKTRLSAILTEIEKTGERFVICRNGNPIADIVPHKKKSRIKTDSFLSQVKIKCDLTEPLTEDEWDV